MSVVTRLKAEIKERNKQIDAIQNECSHPLSCRETVNKGNTVNWDRDQDTYWTAHVCTLCERRWVTDQDWQHTGDRRGMPNTGIPK